MPAPEVLALADDLTGALEVGALFAAAGAQVLVGIECAPETPVPVIDLETRHLPPSAAAARAADFAAGAGPLLFFKIDSTLRGPVAAQLSALTKLWPARPVYFTPAYPALGRTVSNGRLYVNGFPLHSTPFRQDPTHPARTSDIAQLLGPAAGAVQVLDASSDERLAQIADEIHALKAPAIVAGSGGLARHLAAKLPIAHGPKRSLPRVEKPLVVCGSMHRVSAGQIRRAGSWGVVECSAFSHGREALVALVRQTRERIGSIDTLIVFGGDTAFALMRAFGVRFIQPIGEALPGVPVSRFEFEGRVLNLVTKAGGFGGPDLLPRLAATLEIEI